MILLISKLTSSSDRICKIYNWRILNGKTIIIYYTHFALTNPKMDRVVTQTNVTKNTFKAILTVSENCLGSVYFLRRIAEFELADVYRRITTIPKTMGVFKRLRPNITSIDHNNFEMVVDGILCPCIVYIYYIHIVYRYIDISYTWCQ